MNNDRSDGYGYMIVRVTTARGAIPLEGATVTVHNYYPEFENGRGDIIAVYDTDASGLTKRFQLSAPPRTLSMSPGNGRSYETYGISVTKEGYYKQYYINAPVFEGITSVQNADMIPLADNGQIDNYTANGDIFFETEDPLLEVKNKSAQED